jgi:hypothetical protein
MSVKIDDIEEILEQKRPDLDALQEALDTSSHALRVAAIRLMTPAIQRRLFEAAEGRGEVTIDQIVPDADSELEEVIHWGQNTLPAFQSFQKRFCRPHASSRDEHPDRLWGYNHQTFTPVTGPGYFVAYDDPEGSGEVLIDYRELPPERPDAWPEIISNKARLGRFVYHNMVDRLRHISEHVTIGRAYKKGKAMDAWFALVREDWE